MGTYAYYSIYAKNRNGALLSESELMELDSYLTDHDLRCDTGSFSIENRDIYGDFFGYYEGPSSHTSDDMVDALAAYARTHEGIMLQVFIDYDDGGGVQMLFSGNETEVLQKIIAYEEAKKIIWD